MKSESNHSLPPLLHILGWIIGLFIIGSMLFAIPGCDNRFKVGDVGAGILALIVFLVVIALVLLIVGSVLFISGVRSKRP